jgi:hypothetical protein
VDQAGLSVEVLACRPECAFIALLFPQCMKRRESFRPPPQHGHISTPEVEMRASILAGELPMSYAGIMMEVDG